ncbi:adenylosuccinate synthetase [Pararhizobium sp. BT-229]|uniref:adenylosuccinate synthetase n=1 Tax=Pararhizobium sp. BT-229 TaxID=2986923 RepID=UPI0021F791BB|nr:adenylosuccinate synthetase [Pararhizobium sp. BT-229]MCV9963856.1 adenylosuccinate synthetase [Pararhizobium sp. BT-229]
MTKTKKALAVIGAAYGDEGKGLMTDRLVAQTNAPMVVRTNGGAQAGHTVTTPDGRRHVFSHIGSGAFAGAATHLSSFFVAHPMFFLGERERVLALGGDVRVSADPRAIVTTPFDILINQIVEESRGSARHGSCGMGFGETIERNLRADVALSVADLAGSRLGVVSKLERIRRDWVPARLAKLGVAEIPERFKDILKDDAILRRFLDDCDAFIGAVRTMDDADIADGSVFEGAQGLLLDQDYGAFPHVTRSNTGILNMAAVAREAGIDVIEATYATRAYTTRHGAGPLAHEGDDMGYAEIVDPTNIHNDWQGTIRAAPLDLDVLAAAIRHDMARADGVELRASVAVSCLDQVAAGVSVYVGGARCKVSADALPNAVEVATGLAVSAVSEGPTRADVSDVRMAVAA